ncbi:MAG: leucine-rich repeat protein, partial [Clostridia bacterium]|nr:leucine-rich repeat protein [Clostridia bacterium]
VYATGMPLASINNAVSDFDSISFNTSVSDITHILSFNDYELYVYIYSGSTFIGQKEIGLGSSAVTFDGLGDGKDYTFKIVARYNAFDGTGIMLHELATKKIQTPKIVTLDIANTDCFSTELRWSWDINWEDKNFVYLELYQSGRKVRYITYASGECTAILTGLNSNTKYTVKCGYKNGNEIYVEYLPFRTEIVFTPTVEITNIKLPTNANRRLAFGLNITDPSDVCTVTKIEIFSDGSLIRTLGPDKSVYLDNINIFGKYSAKVHYEYDLHDGSGAVSKTTETEFEQYASNLPSAYTEDVWVGRDTIKLTLGLNDALNMSEIKYVELYRDGKLLITLPTQDVYRFENLEFLKQYTAKVYIGYDLGDGYSKGDICNTFTFGTQSEGLAIEDGMIAGIGSCTDTELHLNMPIAPSAFSGNCDITAVYMYDGVTLRKPALNTRYEYYDHGIGARAFQNCANLKTVVLPNTITAVLTCTFDGCTSLENIVIPKNVLCIVESAFTNSGIRQVYIHRALDALQPNAFDKECVILCEIASAHPSWKKNWNTYSTVIFGVVRVESIDGITYAVLGDGSKVEIS